MARKVFGFAIVRRKGDTVFTYRLQRSMDEVRGSTKIKWREVLTIVDRSGRWQTDYRFAANAHKLAIETICKEGWEVLEIVYY